MTTTTPTRPEDLASLARVRAILASGEAQEIRERAGISRAELARALQVDRLTVRRWEMGITRPQLDDALRLAAILDLLAVRA